MNETLQLDGLAFEIRRSARRKTLGLTVDGAGNLVVHATGNATVQELERWTRRKLLWVHRRLAIKQDLTPRMPEPEFVRGEGFYYLGRAFRLLIVDVQEPPLRFEGSHFYLRCDARKQGFDHFRQWYIQAGREWAAKRVALLLRKSATSPARIEVGDLGFRWGSCASNGVVRLNWRLFQLPVRLSDYVICHEMVHLHEPHHGPAFWTALECAMPDWRVRQEELAKDARRMHWCDPHPRRQRSE